MGHNTFVQNIVVFNKNLCCVGVIRNVVLVEFSESYFSPFVIQSNSNSDLNTDAKQCSFSGKNLCCFFLFVLFL